MSMPRLLAHALDVAQSLARSAAGVGLVATVWAVCVAVAFVEVARSEE